MGKRNQRKKSHDRLNAWLADLAKDLIVGIILLIVSKLLN